MLIDSKAENDLARRDALLEELRALTGAFSNDAVRCSRNCARWLALTPMTQRCAK
jgi:hypothetical protein